jgi:hypothetical protein
MTYNKNFESSKIFHCNICDYNTSRKSQYDRHLLTAKHKITYDNLHNDLQNDADKVPKSSKYVCTCGKEYLHRQSL